MFVTCWLNKRKMHYVLVDTGAVTCITFDALTHFVANAAAKLKPFPRKMTQWNGCELPVRGYIELDFTFGGLKLCDLPVLVVDSAPTAFVIGNNLLRRAGSLHVDYKRRLVQIGESKLVPYNTHSPRTGPTRTISSIAKDVRSVHVLHSCTLKPWNARYVQVYYAGAPPGELFAKSDMLFEPRKDFMERHGTHIEPGVAGRDLCAAVWVSNFSDTPRRLFAGDLLGELSPYEEVRQPINAEYAIWAAALGLDPPETSGTNGKPGTTTATSAPPATSPPPRAPDAAPPDGAPPTAPREHVATVGEKDRTADDIIEPPQESTSSSPPVFDISPDAPAIEYERIKLLVEKVLRLAPAVGVGQSKAAPMDIRLKPGAVINVRNYPQRLEASLESLKQASKMYGGNVIRPSISPYNSPVVLARKKDGTWRFCVDYRQVNAATIRDAYQLPRPNDLLARLGGASIFSVLDLASAFWQVRLAEEAKQFTAFSLLSGHWEFEVIPMGLTNSPSWMQRSLEQALGDILYRGALAYIDDIIVYGNTWDEHYERLKTVLERLNEFGFSTRPDKCRFGYRKVKFLGHIVSEDGIRPHDRNISKIAECKVPATNKQLESALALFSYYRRFVYRYADITRPLVNRLTEAQRFLARNGRNPRKGSIPIELTPDEIKAFEEIKTRLCAPDNLLAMPDFERTFVLETDASDYFGHATLSQYDPRAPGKLRPVEFHSFVLPATKAKVGTYERELHCVMEGVRHFSAYLDFTQEFEVRIDHRSLQHLHDQASRSAKYARQVQVLSMYNIRWVHQDADHHQHIDCFTRPPFAPSPEEVEADPERMRELLHRVPELATRECALCKANGDDPFRCRLAIPGSGPLANEFKSVVAAALSSTDPSAPPRLESPVPRAVFIDHLHRDSLFGPVIECIKMQRDEPAKAVSEFAAEIHDMAARYLLDGDLLYYFGPPPALRGRGHHPAPEDLPLVVPATLVKHFLAAYHTSAESAHLGFKKVLPRLLRECHWPNMVADLLAFERGCESCAARTVPRRGPVGTMHPISATRPWEMLGMDILGPLPRTRKGNAYIIVFMDYFTRFAIVCPLRTQTAAEVARTLVNAVILQRGAPTRLLSDRGSAFLSDLMRALLQALGTKKVNTTAYHPQTDGMVERFNHTLVSMLSHYVGTELDDWDEYLNAVAFAYNMSKHATTQQEPFRMLHTYDADPVVGATLRFQPPPGDVGGEWLRKMLEHREKMHKHVQEVDRISKEKAAARRDENSTKVVFVPGQFVFRKNERMRNKLDARLLGPYKVVEAHDNDTYKIRHARPELARGVLLEELVHVEKLYPSPVEYDPLELDHHEDDASDADEPEYRPNAGDHSGDASGDEKSDESAEPAPPRPAARSSAASAAPKPAASAKAPAAPVPRPPAPTRPPTRSTSAARAPRPAAAPASPAPAPAPGPYEDLGGRVEELKPLLQEFRRTADEQDPDKPVPRKLQRILVEALEGIFRRGSPIMDELRAELRAVASYEQLDRLLGKWLHRFRDA